jgi:ribonucleotide monophosphatase NagD (HAD superfamily)
LFKEISDHVKRTLHDENQETTGAVKALRKLQSLGVPMRFVTNTSRESRSKLLESLSKIGFQINEIQVNS